MLKKVFSVGITALLLLSVRPNILATISAAESNENENGEMPFLRQLVREYAAEGKSEEEMKKEREQWKLKQFRENIPKAEAFIKELDREFYDLVTKDDKLKDEYEQDFMEHIDLWLKFQQTASPRAELELKQLIFSGHLELLERQYREGEDKNKRKQIHGSMKKLLSRLFDVKIELREFEIKELQAELNKLKDQLEQAKNHKAEQIDIFLTRMTILDEDTIFDD
ncbi:MAG: hypothetical protein JSU70_05195 [Phycisphaerales bacterium]|nr:MAG: hypothetical protein JSU70_05195 [Phycisphaerales bacterium]